MLILLVLTPLFKRRNLNIKWVLGDIVLILILAL